MRHREKCKEDGLAINTTKLRRKAEELLEKGRYVKVIPLFDQLEQLEADNPRWPQKLGESLLKAGRKEDAIEAYDRAAQAFAEQGFLLKAIAVCKIIIGLDPEHLQTQAALSDLYARQVTRPGGAPAVPTQRSGPPPKETITRGAPLETVNLREAFPEEEEHQGLPVEVFEVPLDESYTSFDDIFVPSEELMPPEQDPSDPIPETTQQLLTQLPSTPLFSSLNKHALRLLIEGLQVEEYKTGQRIIRQGDMGDALYVIVEGSAMVYRDGRARQEINRLGHGDVFGEIALLANLARSATVQAVSSCTVLRISRDLVTELIGLERHVLTTLLGFFRERLVNTITATSPIFAPLPRRKRAQLVNLFFF